jgi:uncharacterized LabA/DUF88 family protein
VVCQHQPWDPAPRREGYPSGGQMNTLRAATLVGQSAIKGKSRNPNNIRSSFANCQVARGDARDGGSSRFSIPKPFESNGKRVLAFLDTPNLFYSLTESSGGDFVPDYNELLSIARSRGSLVRASALVNDGFPQCGAAALSELGYSVARSEGRDCDFRFIAEAIALHRLGDTFLLCSGDHRYAELALALRALGKYVIVAAVVSCCSRELRQSSDEFICFPSKLRKYSKSGRGR